MVSIWWLILSALFNLLLLWQVVFENVAKYAALDRLWRTSIILMMEQGTEIASGVIYERIHAADHRYTPTKNMRLLEGLTEEGKLVRKTTGSIAFFSLNMAWEETK